ncbi:tetratricopeptide repeat protein [Dactylosporangium sp. CA-139066]|uniref:tetratricopeptide repeat protein n=1 Tax=Dactylosporangium sp. CA-139066 TaxID=3239930 RepID=UPI003D94AE78
MAALDVSLMVSGSTVRLFGAGVDVSAGHGGVRPGLSNALYDVRLERSRRGAFAARDVAPQEDPRPGLVSLRRAGELLAESFLPEPVAHALRGLLEHATARHVPLRIGVDAPALTALPWEALPDPLSGRPLALHPLVVVYRRGAAPVPGPLAGPLRIVVAIASPATGGGALLDYEHELRAVLAAVRDARQHQARVEVVPFATTAAIRAALDVPGGAHVLHISAHGRPGVLLLEDEHGDAHEVTADQLLDEAIPPGRMPPVIALAACYTDVDGEQQGSSFAAQLAARGAGAVIGTQTTVTDRYATLLFTKVYAELAARPDPDVVRAVTDARRLVQHDLLHGRDRAARTLAGMDEWGVVTLLANAPEIPVIDRAAPRIPMPAERAATWGSVRARPVGHFVGRRALQRDLPKVLAGDESAGLMLHGIGGVGKTTLAAEVLRRTLQADPQWRVAALFGAVDVDGVLAAVGGVARQELLVRQSVAGPATVAAEAAARRDVPWPDRLAVLRDHVLTEVPVLLVLDNFEDNLDPDTRAITDPDLAGLLTAWASAPARSRLVITSRHPIMLGEGVLPVPVGPLTAAETAKLLWSLPHVDRYAVSDAATDRIWRIVGGHPRSLEYLDALLGLGDGRFNDITERLSTAVAARLGPDRSATWLAQDRTLDTALADTVTLAADDVLLHDHLARLESVPGAIDLLTAISVYREPVPAVALTFHVGTPRAAEEIGAEQARRRAVYEELETMIVRTGITGEEAQLTPADQARLRELVEAARQPPKPPFVEPGHLSCLLGDLAATSLIHHDGDQAMVFMHRWTATELHRRWEGTRNPGPDESPLRQAHRTAAAYWRWRAESRAAGTATALHDLFEARYHLLAAADLEGADSVTGTLVRRLVEIGGWDQATNLIHQTLQWLPAGFPQYPGYIQGLGNLAYGRGDYAEAERLYRQALAMLGPLGDEIGVAAIEHQLGMLAMARRDYVEAEARFQRSLTIEQRQGNVAGVATSRLQLGVLAQVRRDHTEAESQYEQALAAFEQVRDQAGIASVHGQLGSIARERGDYAEAARRYRQALAIFDHLGNRPDLASTYHLLGMLAQDQGDYAAAESSYHRSRAIREQLGDLPGLANTHGRLGMLAQQRGDQAEAERCYRQALTIFERLGDRSGVASVFGRLGALRAASGRLAEAVELYLQALAIGGPGMADTIRALTMVRAQLGAAAFADVATRVLDAESFGALTAVLDEQKMAV